jgi:hypothetical protein
MTVVVEMAKIVPKRNVACRLSISFHQFDWISPGDESESLEIRARLRSLAFIDRFAPVWRNTRY